MSQAEVAIGSRLAVLIDNLDIGGAQRLLQLQLQEMATSHPILVINLGSETRLGRSLEAQGIEVQTIGLSGLTDLFGMLRLERFVARWKPDLIHSHLLYATLVGAVIARRLHLPHVVTLHNEKPDGIHAADRLRHWLEGRALAGGCVDVAIACGPRVGQAQKPRLGTTPLVVVENRVRRVAAVTPDERAKLRAAAGLPERDTILFAAGRLVPQKGFDVLLAAYARAAQNHPHSLLMIAGEGPDLPDLQQQSLALGLGDRLRLLGPVPDLTTLLSLADVFVLPSRHEGLPLVLLEALAVGLPVVATQVGDVETVLGAKGGFLVEPDSVAPLARAMEQVLGDEDLRAQLAHMAREVSERFTDLNAFAAELEAVYQYAAMRRGRRW